MATHSASKPGSITTASVPPVRLLCVEDNPDDLELMALALDRADPQRSFQMHRVDDAGAFSAALADDYDVILCDFNMPRFSPYAALQILMSRRCGTPLVVVTRAIGEEAAVHVLRCGAKDYVTKDRLGKEKPYMASIRWVDGAIQSDLPAKRLVVVKSSQHFRAAFAPLAVQIHYVSAPGSVTADLRQLPYRHIRRPLWPIGLPGGTSCAQTFNWWRFLAGMALARQAIPASSAPST